MILGTALGIVVFLYVREKKGLRWIGKKGPGSVNPEEENNGVTDEKRNGGHTCDEVYFNGEAPDIKQ